MILCCRASLAGHMAALVLWASGSSRPSAGSGGSSVMCRLISRHAISAHGPHIRFALGYGLVHARASAGVRNSAPGEIGPLSTRCASAAALACSLQREEVRVGSTPLIMTGAILVEHHSETNAATFTPVLTKLVQPLAFTGPSVLRLNRQAAKHSDAENSCCHSDECPLDVHNCLPWRGRLCDRNPRRLS